MKVSDSDLLSMRGRGLAAMEARQVAESPSLQFYRLCGTTYPAHLRLKIFTQDD